MKLCYETVVRAPVTDVFAFYSNIANLRRITPPNIKLEIVEIVGNMREGTRITVRTGRWFVVWEWRLRIAEFVPNRRFVDVQEEGPFARYEHLHEFLPHDGGTLLRDTLDFVLPYEPFSAPLRDWILKPQLDRLFAFRHQETRRLLERT